ncbi:hypothetical protein GmHk_15G044550 [Glycine max]|nr:hypothetical protein GmHk_15G044550 [Glycine max]
MDLKKKLFKYPGTDSKEKFMRDQTKKPVKDKVMQAPLELVGLGSSSSMDSFASWKINGSGMEKEEREETPLQGEDESRRSLPP